MTSIEQGSAFASPLGLHVHNITSPLLSNSQVVSRNSSMCWQQLNIRRLREREGEGRMISLMGTQYPPSQAQCNQCTPVANYHCQRVHVFSFSFARYIFIFSLTNRNVLVYKTRPYFTHQSLPQNISTQSDHNTYLFQYIYQSLTLPPRTYNGISLTTPPETPTLSQPPYTTNTTKKAFHAVGY